MEVEVEDEKVNNTEEKEKKPKLTSDEIVRYVLFM
jgi:hypothetical protein